MVVFKGIAFPFRFNSKGGVSTSELSPNDYSRIYESIYQIILTRKNERIMLNDIGTNSSEAIFEATDDLTQMGILRHEIIKALSEQENRISVNDVSISSIYDEESKETKILVVINAYIIKFMTNEQFAIQIPTS